MLVITTSTHQAWNWLICVLVALRLFLIVYFGLLAPSEHCLYFQSKVRTGSSRILPLHYWFAYELVIVRRSLDRYIGLCAIIQYLCQMMKRKFYDDWSTVVQSLWKNQQNEGKARLCICQAWKGIKSSLLHLTWPWKFASGWSIT